MTISLGDAGVTFPDATVQPSAANFADNPWMRLGECLVDQRNEGTAYTITAGAAAAYTLDGWLASSTGANVTVQQVTATGDFKNAIQLTGAASVTGANLIVRCESKDITRFVSTASRVAVWISNSLLTNVSWTASYANSADNFTAVTQIATGNITITSTLTKYFFDIPASASIGNGLQITFHVGAQTSGTWTMTGLDQMLGTATRPYPHRVFEDVFRVCQRYLPVHYAKHGIWIGMAGTATLVDGAFPLNETPRILPTNVIVVGSWFTNTSGVQDAATVTFQPYTGGFFLTFTIATSRFAANNAVFLNGSVGGKLIFTGAEL